MHLNIHNLILTPLLMVKIKFYILHFKIKIKGKGTNQMLALVDVFFLLLAIIRVFIIFSTSTAQKTMLDTRMVIPNS